jgi:hypothetical protein
LSKILVPLAAAIIAYCLAILINVGSIPLSIMLKELVVVGFGIVILVSGFFDKSETIRVRKVAEGMWARFGWAGNAPERTTE